MLAGGLHQYFPTELDQINRILKVQEQISSGKQFHKSWMTKRRTDTILADTAICWPQQRAYRTIFSFFGGSDNQFATTTPFFVMKKVYHLNYLHLQHFTQKMFENFLNINFLSTISLCMGTSDSTQLSNSKHVDIKRQKGPFINSHYWQPQATFE